MSCGNAGGGNRQAGGAPAPEQQTSPITYRTPTEEQEKQMFVTNAMFQNAEQYGSYGCDRNEGMINALLNRGEISRETYDRLKRVNENMRKLYGAQQQEEPRGLGVATVNPARTATSKRQEKRRRRQLDEWMGKK